jgi:hypothetical protein
MKAQTNAIINNLRLIVAGPYLSNKATRIGQPKKLIKCLCRGPYLAINLRGEKHRLEDQAEQLSKPWPPMMLGTSSIFCSRINAGPGNTLNGGPYHPLFLPDSAAVRWFFGSYRKTLILRRLLNTILFLYDSIPNHLRNAIDLRATSRQRSHSRI